MRTYRLMAQEAVVKVEEILEKEKPLLTADQFLEVGKILTTRIGKTFSIV